MGGLHSRELLALLRGLDGINIVGADVVEVAPAYDHADITTLAAATLVFDLLALMVNRSKTAGMRELESVARSAS
jgi:agmatinase